MNKKQKMQQMPTMPNDDVADATLYHSAGQIPRSQSSQTERSGATPGYSASTTTPNGKKNSVIRKQKKSRQPSNTPIYQQTTKRNRQFRLDDVEPAELQLE